MIPQSQPKPKKNSSKVNLTISFVFHALLIGVLVYFAAREGYLGKKLQKISVQMVKTTPPPSRRNSPNRRRRRWNRPRWRPEDGTAQDGLGAAAAGSGAGGRPAAGGIAVL